MRRTAQRPSRRSTDRKLPLPGSRGPVALKAATHAGSSGAVFSLSSPPPPRNGLLITRTNSPKSAGMATMPRTSAPGGPHGRDARARPALELAEQDLAPRLLGGADLAGARRVPAAADQPRPGEHHDE